MRRASDRQGEEIDAGCGQACFPPRRVVAVSSHSGGFPLADNWLQEYVSAFGDCKNKLQGRVGQAEASIRKPLDVLITSIGSELSFTVVAFDEAADAERDVRPDYAVQVDGAVTGYVEVKAPGENLDPSAFKGHNLTQWNRLKDLPNLVLQKRHQVATWRGGEPIGEPVHLMGGKLRKLARRYFSDSVSRTS